MKRRQNYINMFSKRSFICYSAFLKRRLHLRSRNFLSFNINSTKSLFNDSFYSRRSFFFKIFLSKYIFVKLFTLKESNVKDKYSISYQSTMSKITSNVKIDSYSYSYNDIFMFINFINLLTIYKIIVLLIIKNYSYKLCF